MDPDRPLYLAATVPADRDRMLVTTEAVCVNELQDFNLLTLVSGSEIVEE